MTRAHWVCVCRWVTGIPVSQNLLSQNEVRGLFRACKLTPPQILHPSCVGVFEKGTRGPSYLWEKLCVFCRKRHPLSQPQDNSLGAYCQVGWSPESPAKPPLLVRLSGAARIYDLTPVGTGICIARS